MRSPTAPTVSDLVNGPPKSTKTRAGSVPVRNQRRGEFEGVGRVASKYASQRLLLEEEEEFLLQVVARAARSKHGLSEQLLKSCARKIVSRSSPACTPGARALVPAPLARTRAHAPL